ncbi:hypothetical protein [Luteolibacter luteus]|uniref:Uncharacterized protein n=1 Tax=Luteolibacter luteus TaxID=2728835 RepID=A0A858RDD4_9BACT|nr:hypothetical protein [Luteolibacter luteus]QJE94604.1 hypothetical protein HHL09_02000 [Luteolibacter luteus]
MKTTLAFILALPLFAAAAEKDLATKIAEHQDGSRKLSEQQDEMAADVQQLIIEQTHPKVIELLEGVEQAMDEASGLLLEFDTGGITIAAETDVIEKIFEAAKERQKQQGQGQGQPNSPGGAMLDMMERMMGKEPGGEQPGQQPGQQGGEQGGEGQTGDSDSANSASNGASTGKEEERRVPKSSGKAGQSLPREFQDALDAYNRAAEKLAK